MISDAYGDIFHEGEKFFSSITSLVDLGGDNDDEDGDGNDLPYFFESFSTIFTLYMGNLAIDFPLPLHR